MRSVCTFIYWGGGQGRPNLPPPVRSPSSRLFFLGFLSLSLLDCEILSVVAKFCPYSPPFPHPFRTPTFRPSLCRLLNPSRPLFFRSPDPSPPRPCSSIFILHPNHKETVSDNINTYFSVWAKWCLRGGVGGQFPRNLNWAVHSHFSFIIGQESVPDALV